MPARTPGSARRELQVLYSVAFLIARIRTHEAGRGARVLVGQLRLDRRTHVAIRGFGRDTATDMRTVVIVDNDIPRVSDSAAAERLLEIARGFGHIGCRVTILGLASRESASFDPVLGSWGQVDRCSPDRFGRILCSGDVIWMSGALVAARITAVASGAPATLVYDSVDLIHRRLQRQARLNRSRLLRLQGSVTRRLERRLADVADSIACVSEGEAEFFVALRPRARTIFVVPTVQRVPETPPPPPTERVGMLFFGHFSHQANVDAVEYFVEAVAPRIWADLPDMALTVAGANIPESIEQLASVRVRVVGWVDDIDALIDRSRILVAPVRFGAGMKGKVARCMARGLPVVTTPIGAEGLHLVSNESALISEDPATFAYQCVRLLTDDAVWRRISDRSQELAARNLKPGDIEPLLRDLLES